MTGRPTDCTPELTELFIKSLESGLSIERSCDLCEISQATYRSWRIRGETGEEPFVSFLICIKKTKAEWIKKTISAIERAAEDRIIQSEKGVKTICGDWTAKAWLLERLHRQEFGRNVNKIGLSDPPKELSEPEKLIYLSNEIVNKMKVGEITAEEANAAAAVIESHRKILQMIEGEQRMQEIEKRLGIKSTA